jgi:hypothetical protein
LKLSTLGVRFVVDDEEVATPSRNRPTTLVLNGRPLWSLSCCSWGFHLAPDEDAVFANLLANHSMVYNRKSLLHIFADSPGFVDKPAAVQMRRVRDAIAARTSKELADFAVGAINWWLDQALENDSHSP